MTTDHDDFWGDQADWPTAAIPIARHERSVGRASDEITTDVPVTRADRVRRTGAVPITRAHRRPDADATSAHHRVEVDPGQALAADVGERDLAAPAAGTATFGSATDDTPVAPVWDAQWAPRDAAARGAVDPRLFRLGALAVIITLLVPLIAGFGSGDSDDLVTLATEEATAEAAAGEESLVGEATVASTATTVPGEQAASATSVAEPPPTEATEAVPPSDDASTESAAQADGSDETAAAGDQTEASAEAALAEQLCAVDYQVRTGDFWIRLADGAGVDLAELLEANAATVDTPLHPGGTICLPAGSATPPPPAAPTTAAPSSSGGSSSGGSTATSPPANTSPPQTAAPTTAPPTTAAPLPPPPAPAEVERIIRAVWPDELEERALEIAWRESNYKANVKNYCCYGLFQLYWNVHKRWLNGLGISSAVQLYDAETNTRAAYALYQRSGGWGPWGG